MKKEQMEEIEEKLKKGVENVFTSDNYIRYLDMLSNFPRYSYNNQMLIAIQTNYKATLVQSFNAWKKLGRKIKKGEKGIQILAPVTHKRTVKQKITEDDGSEKVEEKEVKWMSFRVVYTFDVSQTEGEELPSIMTKMELTDDVENYEKMLEKLVTISKVPILFEEITHSNAKGYYHTQDKIIVIKDGMSQAQTIKTIIHEMAHSILHEDTDKDKKTKEVEAESVAYIVCNHLGIDTSDYSFGYVAGWSSNRNHEELDKSLSLISKTAKDIISQIEDEQKGD